MNEILKTIENSKNKLQALLQDKNNKKVLYNWLMCESLKKKLHLPQSLLYIIRRQLIMLPHSAIYYTMSSKRI